MRRPAVVWFCLLLSACAPRVVLDRPSPPVLASEPSGRAVGRVVRVIDGDTVEVEVVSVAAGPGAGAVRPGLVYGVRLLGIDAPESVHPERAPDCFGAESSLAAKALLDGADVTLVKDVEDVDAFGRLLRYVYLGAELANARLVLNGYARTMIIPPNRRHEELLALLEAEARTARLGLWGSCGPESAAAG